MNARSWAVLLVGVWLAACESEPRVIGPRPRENASIAVGGDNFIVFHSDRSGGGDIYLYDASTFSLVSLPGLNTDAREIPGSITPDGQLIAFQRTTPGGDEDVVLYDRSTSSEVPLPGLNSGYDDAGPSLTPDGRFIAFVTARSGDANYEDVLLYDRSTSSLVPLPGLNTNGPGGFHEGSPSISADGRLIAFRSNRSGGGAMYHVFLYDRSTSSLVPLPGLNDPAFVDDHPSISADGQFIAFYSTRGGVERTYLYDRSTSSLVPLPGLDFPAGAPSLSADANYIAFHTGFFSGTTNGVFVYDRSRCSLVDLPGLNEPTFQNDYPAIAFSGSLTNPNSFQLKCRVIRGIAYDAGVLWVTHSAPDVSNVIRISKINPQTGATLAESNDLNWNGRGIAVGGSLWVVDALADVVHRVDPSNFGEIGPPFRTPGSEPSGIAFDGTDLWLTDPFLQRIDHLSTNGVVLGGFSIPNLFRQGLEWDGNGMWTNTGATEQSHYLTNGTIDATKTFQGLPSGTSIGDIAIGNGKVYISAGNTIYTQDWSAAANRPPTALACVELNSFVKSLDPSPAACSHLQQEGSHVAKVEGYITDPTQFPPRIILDGSGSSDPEHDPLTFTWKRGSSVLGQSAVLDVTDSLGPGEYTLNLSVCELCDGSHDVTDQVAITIPEPVILVHGWHGSPESFGQMGQFLSKPETMSGRALTVVAYDYSKMTGLVANVGIEDIAADFARWLGNENAHSTTGVPGISLPRGSPYLGTINLVAHSEGGLVVRAYMTGGAGVPYRGEFKRLVMAGTPNYGLLASTLLAGLAPQGGKSGQAHEMAFGTSFIWNLDATWDGAPPLSAENVLGIAGSIGPNQGCTGAKLNGSTDGVTELTSVALPRVNMSRVVYVGYKHWEGLLAVKDCPAPEIVRATHPLHDTFRVVRNFFVPQIELVPLGDPRPESLRSFGMLVVRIQDQSTGAPITDVSSDQLFLLRADAEVAGCVDKPPSKVRGSPIDRLKYHKLRCMENNGTGMTTLLDVPVLDEAGGGTWVVTLDDKRTQLGGFALIEKGRPSRVIVQLCSTSGCS